LNQAFEGKLRRCEHVNLRVRDGMQTQRDEAMAHGLMVGAFDNVATAIRASGGLAHTPLGRAGSLRVTLSVCSIQLLPRYSLGRRTCAASQAE